MKEITLGLSSSPALKQLMRILNMGGEIIKAPREISIMLNGLRYYSMEVSIDDDSYIIQGFEEEAVILYKTAGILFADKDTAINSEMVNVAYGRNGELDTDKDFT